MGQDPIELVLQTQDFLCLDTNIRSLPLYPSPGLVNHDPGIGQSKSFACRAGGEQHSPHAGGLANAVRGHITLKELHGVIDGQSGGHRSARRIHVKANVLFGVFFFGEQMWVVQWCALFMVCCGVIYLTVYYGQFPWIALSLAVCFATYGLLHKKNSLPALEGFCLETIVLFIPAVLFLLILEIKGNGSFGHVDLSQSLLLVGTGIVTAAPLLLFGYAASKIPLSTLGLLQYLAPTINLLIGIFMYGESFPRERMIGFMLIWVALLLYAAENTVRRIRVGRKVL